MTNRLGGLSSRMSPTVDLLHFVLVAATTEAGGEAPRGYGVSPERFKALVSEMVDGSTVTHLGVPAVIISGVPVYAVEV